MAIMVTGGAGFIGSALLRFLIKETDHNVINVDKLTYAGNLDSLREILGSSRYQFEQVDICNLRALQKVFDKYQPDYVIHLAAESHVDRSIDGPAVFIQTNIVGTYNLLEASREYLENKKIDEIKRSHFRFHHVSTDEVYGDLGDTSDLFVEETPYSPSSPYAASKASSDHLVRAWHRTFNLPILITNCSNNYGPYQYPEKLIPLTILNSLEGKKIPIYGTGEQIRDWLHVEDHVRALYKVLLKGRPGETYNIGGLNEEKNIEVVNMICSILDGMIPNNFGLKSYQELIEHVADRPGHDKRYAIDASKLRRELGWRPLESFESGIRKTVEWYLQNRDWVDKVRCKI